MVNLDEKNKENIKQKKKKQKPMRKTQIDGWNCNCCDFYNVYSSKQSNEAECGMCGMTQQMVSKDVSDNNALDISLMMSNLDLANEENKITKTKQPKIKQIKKKKKHSFAKTSAD